MQFPGLFGEDGLMPICKFGRFGKTGDEKEADFGFLKGLMADQLSPEEANLAEAAMIHGMTAEAVADELSVRLPPCVVAIGETVILLTSSLHPY